MSGPWEDFQPAPVEAPAVGPWQDFAAPVEEEEGLSATVTATDPVVVPLNPDANADELRAGLTEMVGRRAPFKEIDDYMAASGFTFDPETRRWFETAYTDAPPDSFINDIAEWDIQAPPPEVSTGRALWRGVQDAALRGWDDEVGALGGAAGNALGTALGLNQSDMDFWEIYDVIRNQEQANKDAAFEQHPIAYGAGFVPGMFLGPSYARVMGGPGASGLRRVGGVAGVGAIEGGISGAGNAEGGLGDRLASGATGAGLGAALAPATMPIADVASAVGSRALEFLPGRGNNLNTGLDALVTRAPQNAEEMAGRALAMREAGVDPRLLDVVDESGRGVIRAAGMKMTPAREDFARQADSVYLDMQDRVADQARRNITTEPRTARQIANQIAQEQQAMGPRFDAVRGEVIPVTEDMLNVFRTREGQAALLAAEGLMLPGERDAIRGLMRAVRNVEKLGSAEEQAAKLFPGFERLGPEAKRQVLAQLDIKDPLDGLTMTVDIADKFARAIGFSPSRAPGLQRVAENLASTVRNAARTASPGYNQVLEEFAAAARVGDAAAGTGRFEGTDFLGARPEQYTEAVALSSPDAGAIVDQATGLPTMSETDALRIRARDEIVDAATRGGGQHAPAVARQFARGSAQQKRDAALLGGRQARELEAGMEAELARLDNTRFVDPRIGSKTAPSAADEAAAAGLDAITTAATGGKWGLVRMTSQWLKSAGIRGVDAERIVRDAMDPARTNDAIAHLVQRGVAKDRARSLVRTIAATSTGRAVGGAVGTEEKPRPPSSVRAIMREGQKQS